MDIEKVVSLLKEVKDDFISTSKRRMETSSVNKNAHTQAIKLVEKDNWTLFGLLLTDSEYKKPFSGVIACLPEDCKNKAALFDEVRT